MRIPVIEGLIERRILVNYRVRPDVLESLLPKPFRPQLVQGWGMAGVCLIRLANIRPAFLKLPWGLRSENAAHRIAVEWDEGGTIRSGVFIPRRDTSSRLNSLAGGRIFPGVHHQARFDVRESTGCYDVQFRNLEGEVQLRVSAKETSQFPRQSIFSSLDEASDFFAKGSLGYSPSNTAGVFDGLQLDCQRWEVRPLSIQQVESHFFHVCSRFPARSVEFDNALLMRDVPHRWIQQADLRGD